MPSIAREAEKIIKGARRKSYGPIEESLKAAAKMASAIITKKLKEDITAHEFALIMAGYKLVREGNKAKRDNRLDGIGYILLADKVNDI